MLNWLDGHYEVKPLRRDIKPGYCPEWYFPGYQVAQYNGKVFYYEDPLNDIFSDIVEKLAVLYEAD